MECPHCTIGMVNGFAIEFGSNYRGIAFIPKSPKTWETLRLIKVLKCRACGHSEEIENETIADL